MYLRDVDSLYFLALLAFSVFKRVYARLRLRRKERDRPITATLLTRTWSVALRDMAGIIRILGHDRRKWLRTEFLETKETESSSARISCADPRDRLNRESSKLDA